MAVIPGLKADVYFGDAATPLPDWRSNAPDEESDDDDTSPENHRAVAAMLGFDPRELNEDQLEIDDVELSSEDTDQRLQLMAEILTLMFGEDAEEVTKGLLDDIDAEPDDSDDDGIELATVGATRYGSKSPGKGWVRLPPGPRGGTKWIYQPSGSPPTPPTPGPAPAPKAGSSKYQAQKAAALAVHAAALAKLKAGGQLTTAEKNTLAKKLTTLPVADLKSLHAALGGTGALGTKPTVVSAVKSLLAGTPTPPTPPAPPPTPPVPPVPTPPAPSPAPQPPAPSTQPGPVAKSSVAVTWKTGSDIPHGHNIGMDSLNGVDFAPAPPKFWEKVKDVDVKEPKPLKKIDRVSVLIQEPDGRIWIVQPTNEFGNRKYTMPGGGVEPGLTDQQNALKEIWEETGLQVEITGFAGDFEDSNNQNNGRLYIGKRVGGAPWDAKIEQHIIDRKTGKQAAESSQVNLVSPEEAAKLLHRTDDLAQLMVALPPPVGTPTSGKGSEPLKKFYNAIKPKAQAYLDAGGQGDGYIHAVQEMRGFNEKPKVVSKNDMDNLLAAGGHIEMLRGVKPIYDMKTYKQIPASDLAEQFRSGEHFPGFGCFGNGTYADSTKGVDTSSQLLGNAAYKYAGHHGNTKGSGAIVRIALPKTAKIIKQSELEKLVPQHPAGFKTSSTQAERDQWWGIQAAIAGYDAIEVDGKSKHHGGYGKGFYVILNRGVLVVQKEDASTHVIK